LIASGPVLFYDGECKFCNESVNFILRNEKNKEIKFAHLQGEHVTEFLESNSDRKVLDSIYFLDDNKVYWYADAVIHLSKYLRSPYKHLSWIRFVPKPIRNEVYKLIARYRKRLMGTQSCLFPKVLDGRIANFKGHKKP